MGRERAKTGSRRDQQSLRHAILEQASKTSVIETVRHVNEQERAPFWLLLVQLEVDLMENP